MMGGLLSGRPAGGGKRTTEELRGVDVRELARAGLIAPGARELEGAALRLEWTPCNFGGERPWFVCPGCGRRAAILYEDGGRLLCRRCLDLAYRSQREGDLDLARRRLEKAHGALEERLGEAYPGRPKGMRRTTHRRLLEDYLAAMRAYEVLRREWLAKISEHFDRRPPGTIP